MKGGDIMLNAKNFGLACGIIWSVLVLIMGWAAAWIGWTDAMVEIFASIYIGYSASFLGAIIGAIWAFFDGFIGGYIFVWLYNKLNK